MKNDLKISTFIHVLDDNNLWNALKKEKIRFYQKGNAFLCKSSLVFWRKEDTYRKINKKNKTIYKEKENNGNNGNNSRNTGGA